MTRRHVSRRLREWTESRASPLSSGLMFVTGFIVFILLVEHVWGMTGADAGTILPTATMWAHGVGACALVTPVESAVHPLSGPVYPLLDAFIQWVLRLGSTVPFPSHLSADHCLRAYDRVLTWASRVPLGNQELNVGLVAWPVLALGSLSVLRTTARSHTRWEWVLVWALALSPGAFFAYTDYYHPEDVLALGFFLACAGAFRREHYVTSGVLATLAVASQQNVVLAVFVIGSLIPYGRALGRALVGAAGAATLIVVPLTLWSGPRVIPVTLFGTGLSDNPEWGTWMAQVHLSGSLALVLSRGGPLVATAVLVVWVHRRRPLGALGLLGALEVAFSARLFFEENLWGYYSLGLLTCWTLASVVKGRISSGAVVWTALLILNTGIDNGQLWIPLSIARHERVWWFQVLLLPLAVIVSVNDLRAGTREGGATRSVNSLATEDAAHPPAGRLYS